MFRKPVFRRCGSDHPRASLQKPYVGRYLNAAPNIEDFMSDYNPNFKVCSYGEVYVPGDGQAWAALQRHCTPLFKRAKK